MSARLTLGQAEHAFSNNIVLNLVGASRDSAAARCKHPERPPAAVDFAKRLVLWSEVEIHRPSPDMAKYRPDRPQSGLGPVRPRLKFAQTGREFKAVVPEEDRN